MYDLLSEAVCCCLPLRPPIDLFKCTLDSPLICSFQCLPRLPALDTKAFYSKWISARFMFGFMFCLVLYSREQKKSILFSPELRENKLDKARMIYRFWELGEIIGNTLTHHVTPALLKTSPACFIGEK